MIDSDVDGIDDGREDFDDDGLNRTNLLYRYCPWDGTTLSSRSATLTLLPRLETVSDDFENYTNFEEFQNGTNPVNPDSDGDQWLDGSEVYHQDQDDDGMWAGWEYYFGFDPFDPADANIDS